MVTMFKNRPLSPHLSIYIGQFTSVYSIWHRITGVLLCICLLLIIIFCKTLSFIFLNHTFIIYILEIQLYIKNCIFVNFILFFVYHLFNGLKHISWDLGFNLRTYFIKYVAKLNTFLLIVLLQNILTQ